MRRILAILGLLVASIAVVHAQSNEPAECPTISVTGPGGVVLPGETASFTVNVDTKGKELSLQYNWSISVGIIIKGQGTPTINVKVADSGLTATVEIAGLPSHCSNTFTETSFGDPVPDAIKLDEIVGPLSKTSVNRFQKIVDEANRNRNARLYVILYGTAASIKRKRDVLLKHLVIRCNYDAMRITFVEAPSRIDHVDVWLVPPGASNPTPDK